MGGGNSMPVTAPSMGRSEQEIVNLMMPVFYLDEPLTEADVDIAKASWKMVVDDTAPGFVALKGTPGFEFPSCVMFFFDNFYSRLFDIHPMCRPMFKSGLKSQGKFLVKMISMAVGMINEPEKFSITMVKLTETHNERGVKAIEYGIVGEVLFWVMRRCLGEAYDNAMHRVWVLIVSRMIKIMIPVSVAYELKTGGIHQKDRFSEMSRVASGGSSFGHDNESKHDEEHIEKKYTNV